MSNKKTTKVICTILSLTIVLVSLAGCKGNTDVKQSPTKSTSTAIATVTTADVATPTPVPTS